MDYWKSKVLPKIKKILKKGSSKKADAAETCKAFDETKEKINKEFEEKKLELQPKVDSIYKASSEEIKIIVKERKEGSIKKNSSQVHKFLEELVQIEFPGSKQVCEASSKHGAALVSGPVFFIFEKVSILIPAEEKETIVEKEKELVVEEEKVTVEESTQKPETVESSKPE